MGAYALQHLLAPHSAYETYWWVCSAQLRHLRTLLSGLLCLQQHPNGQFAIASFTSSMHLQLSDSSSMLPCSRQPQPCSGFFTPLCLQGIHPALQRCHHALQRPWGPVLGSNNRFSGPAARQPRCQEDAAEGEAGLFVRVVERVLAAAYRTTEPFGPSEAVGRSLCLSLTGHRRLVAGLRPRRSVLQPRRREPQRRRVSRHQPVDGRLLPVQGKQV